MTETGRAATGLVTPLTSRTLPCCPRPHQYPLGRASWSPVPKRTWNSRGQVRLPDGAGFYFPELFWTSPKAYGMPRSIAPHYCSSSEEMDFQAQRRWISANKQTFWSGPCPTSTWNSCLWLWSHMHGPHNKYFPSHPADHEPQREPTSCQQTRENPSHVLIPLVWILMSLTGRISVLGPALPHCRQESLSARFYQSANPMTHKEPTRDFVPDRFSNGHQQRKLSGRPPLLSPSWIRSWGRASLLSLASYFNRLRLQLARQPDLNWLK